jgi:hypothetical protein
VGVLVLQPADTAQQVLRGYLSDRQCPEAGKYITFQTPQDAIGVGVGPGASEVLMPFSRDGFEGLVDRRAKVLGGFTQGRGIDTRGDLGPQLNAPLSRHM